jgi:hypothetical protein
MTKIDDIKTTRFQKHSSKKAASMPNGEHWWKGILNELFKKISWNALDRIKFRYQRELKRAKKRLLAGSLLLMSFVFLMVGSAMLLEAILPNPPFPHGSGILAVGIILGLLGLILNLHQPE